MHKSHNICTSPLLHLLWLGRWLLTETMRWPHHKECQGLGEHAVTAEPTASFLRMKERIWGLKGKNISLLCCTVTFASIQCCCPQKTGKVLIFPQMVSRNRSRYLQSVSGYIWPIWLPALHMEKNPWTWVTLSSLPSALVQWKSNNEQEPCFHQF